ncbi:hypothetical protein RB195_010208 [Necator americanus]|uniref:Phlebovirus glycoprotein G2 fusion domain-containing protein n=1 Tax=Necator americanus TaxID=51031 RepID=A0ABR1CWX7_NECAM
MQLRLFHTSFCGLREGVHCNCIRGIVSFVIFYHNFPQIHFNEPKLGRTVAQTAQNINTVQIQGSNNECTVRRRFQTFRNQKYPTKNL